MKKECYRIFLRLIKEKKLYRKFKKSINNEELYFITENNSYTFISRFASIINHKYRNGDIYATEMYAKIPEIIAQYNKIINEYSKILARNYFNARQDLKENINIEIKKSDWTDYETIEDSIKDSYNTYNLIPRLFDWKETKDGSNFWSSIHNDYTEYIYARI